MDDENRSLNEEVSMDSNQQSSILSRSHIDNDIVEVEGMIRFFLTCIKHNDISQCLPLTFSN
jgi:hypothetical protein